MDEDTNSNKESTTKEPAEPEGANQQTVKNDETERPFESGAGTTPNRNENLADDIRLKAAANDAIAQDTEIKQKISSLGNIQLSITLSPEMAENLLSLCHGRGQGSFTYSTPVQFTVSNDFQNSRTTIVSSTRAEESTKKEEFRGVDEISFDISRRRSIESGQESTKDEQNRNAVLKNKERRSKSLSRLIKETEKPRINRSKSMSIIVHGDCYIHDGDFKQDVNLNKPTNVALDKSVIHVASI